MSHSQQKGPNRRDVLVAGALGLASLAIDPGAAAAETFTRRSVTDPAAGADLETYRQAVEAMLALPPEDPRNWYRIALVHAIDCPHGNWWFLPWHRGYLGHFEQICRELTGSTTFAIPYWDWTETPRVPDSMFVGALTPTDQSFIDSFATFRQRFESAVGALDWWTPEFRPDGSFDEDCRYAQLLNRGVRGPQDLWFDINEDPRWKLFFDRDHARGLSKNAPDLDPPTQRLVSLAILLDALSPRDFSTFASPETLGHSVVTGFGVLEGLPHNMVHNSVGGAFNGQGGFMQGNLSPIDPLFLLHHANIDRLWDVWTRKQEIRNPADYPILPAGYLTPSTPRTPFARWASENFAFFVDGKGNPASKNKAGDFAAIGAFSYAYTPGSGEQIVLPPVAVAPSLSLPPDAIQATIAQKMVGPEAIGTARLQLPAAALEAGRTADALKPYLRVTVEFAAGTHGQGLDVVLDPEIAPNAPADARFLGTLSLFGHHGTHGPVSFLLPLSPSLQQVFSGPVSGPVDLAVRVTPAVSTEHQMHLQGAVSETAQVVDIELVMR